MQIHKKTHIARCASETVEKLRFSDNLCFDFAKHGRPKVPMRKLSPSESMKTGTHAPVFMHLPRRKCYFTCMHCRGSSVSLVKVVFLDKLRRTSQDVRLNLSKYHIPAI